MRVYSNITIDMQHPRALQTVHMMQGDRSARYVSVMLTDHGAKWMVPKECKQVSVSFCKPDGKGGTYTKLQSGAYACEWTANWINVGIHPQALTTAGFVWCNITLLAADGSALGIYPFVIDVIARPASRITSTDYLDAVSDARLVLVRADLPTDQTQISVARSACLLAPRPGDLALGANGYLGKITDTDATQATVEGLGMVWGPTESFNPGSITPASIGAIPVPTAYKAEEDAVLAVAAVDAAGAPTAWRYRNMPDSLFFAPEIEIPGKPYAADDATTEIDLSGYALLPENAVRVGATVVGKNGYMAEVTALNDDGDPVVRSTGDRLISNGFDGLFYTTYGVNEFLRVAEVDADGKPVGFYSTPLQRLIAIPDEAVRRRLCGREKRLHRADGIKRRLRVSGRCGRGHTSDRAAAARRDHADRQRQQLDHRQRYAVREGRSAYQRRRQGRLQRADRGNQQGRPRGRSGRIAVQRRSLHSADIAERAERLAVVSGYLRPHERHRRLHHAARLADGGRCDCHGHRDLRGR